MILPGERKSVEPITARIEPGRVQATHQSLLHLVGQSRWSDETLLPAIRESVLPTIVRHGAISAWIVDDTGFLKKGNHSVGVARQYCGQIGKEDNCQVAVSLSIANEHASLPIAYQLYLPETWANDAARRAKAGVPEKVRFQTKPRIALDQIQAALDAEVPPATVLADAAYGDDTDFRDALTERGLRYVIGIRPATTLWPPGEGPLPPRPRGRRGYQGKRLRRDAEHQPVSAKKMAQALAAEAWQTLTWREGSNAPLTSRFAAVRVRPAHRDTLRDEPRPEEWFVVEWPEGEAEPTKYWLATLAPGCAITDLVATAKRRWRIERDYLELKQEIGLGDFEGRGWRGFHHHATLCIAAYGFLVSERSALPTSAKPIIKAPAVSKDFRARGSPCST